MSLVTESLVPVSDISITTKNLNISKINVYFDTDNNGILSDESVNTHKNREK